ncbi:SLAP domain-containing protein [Lactobacillus sp. LL6]|uniref:SLAP domain-containing protein n=1 Tax=Lactobacillus sp. LL6 TaxID=2596827 RepID=UPI0011855114|nr:SLAP domain-containing protein [Lactobacillus sp. LL6]TSO26853.1 hypothetical protein FOD82_07475 [Lactobacillus sp. LL6]
MKKNLRIVSAAAAALLAVAPVAVSTVSTANASNFEVTSTNSEGAKVLKKDLALKTVTITGSTLDSLFNENSINSTEMQALGFDAGTVARNNKVSAVTAGNNGVFTQTLQFKAYWPKNLNTTPALQSGYKLSNKTWGYVVPESYNAPTKGTEAQLMADAEKNAVTFVTSRDVTGINEQGTPYFYNKTNNKVIENGQAEINLQTVQTSTFSAQDLLNQFNKVYGFGHNAGKSQVSMETTSSDIEKQLVAQNIKRTSNGNFDYPSSNFHFTVTVKAENGKTASLNVTVRADKFNINYPTFKIAGVKGNLENSDRIVNGTAIPAAAVTNYFYTSGNKNEVRPASAIVADIEKNTTAYVSGNTSNNNTISAKFDDSAIKNATQTGFYPLVITATNPAGDTSKITVSVFVLKNAVDVQSTQWLKNDTKTVTINGNKVTEDNNTLKKGDAVQTFGTITVDGKSYTRLNNAGSNTFVPSDALSNTKVDTTPAQPASVAQTGTKYVMTNSAVYNDKGQSVGKKIYAFTDKAVYGEKTINGKKYYRVSGTAEEYIKASNVQGEGTKRTLKHNAYIYATSKKRASKKVLKKGTTVRTYGYAHTFKNGKKYYRIEGATATKKMYVKVANFK